MPEPVPAGFPFIQGLLVQSMFQTQTSQLQNKIDIHEKLHESLQVPKSILATNFNPALDSCFSWALMAHHGLISLAFARLKSLCKYALLTVICSAFFSTVTLQAGNACGSSNKSLAVCGFLFENGSADTSSSHFFIAWSFVSPSSPKSVKTVTGEM